MGTIIYIEDFLLKKEVPSPAMASWLCKYDENSGRLPVKDSEGKRISARTMKACEWRGWAIMYIKTDVEGLLIYPNSDEAIWHITDKGKAALKRFKCT